MSEQTYTTEQQQAIGQTGRVIVSASAGSGKTFVMIERLVSLILNGADVRNVLAVTFTNKAAAQMREKLRKAILRKIGELKAEATLLEENHQEEEAKAVDLQRERIKQQLNSLPMADICTIHAFCGRILRAYFYLADINVDFRILSPESAEGKELSALALDEVFEEEYTQKESKFYRLLSVYFRNKSDMRLRETVLRVHSQYRGMDKYQEKLAEIGKQDRFEEVCRDLEVYYHSCAEEIIEGIEGCLLSVGEDRPKISAYGKQVIDYATLIKESNLFEMATLPQPDLPRRPTVRKTEEELYETMQEIGTYVDNLKDLCKELSKTNSREVEYRRYLDGNERAAALAELALRYDERFTAKKREKGVIDYDDLEHLAMKILEDEEAGKAIRSQYRYVFVDEYQDVNPAQEKIINLVGGEEVFLVGDRKQSIYAFRGGKSKYFTDKMKSFDHLIYLTENFRSAEGVIDCVNRVFLRSMTKPTCGFSYADGSVLHGGRRYEGHEGKTLFHLYPKGEREKAEAEEVYSVTRDRGSLKENEQSKLLVSLILEELGSDWYDVDAPEGEREKKVQYGDIAILVRSKGTDARNIVAALSARDIPVTAAADVNVCDFWEGKLLVDWLSYLDNAKQDIPFAGALLSSLGGFTEEDLAQIRLRFPSAWYFREACENYVEKMDDEISKRLKKFYTLSTTLRKQCAVRTAEETMNELLHLGLEAEILAKKDGTRRMQRVHRLTSEGHGISVHEFLGHLDRLNQNVDYSELSGDNSVKVLTMHASKGLEFPVVFLVNMDAQFHKPSSDELLITDEYGISTKSYDVENKIAYDTLLRRASIMQSERDTVKDELNLLYVAMTRARYRLHVLMQDGQKKSQRISCFADFIDKADCASYFVPSPHDQETCDAFDEIPVRRSDESKRQTEAILSCFEKPYPYSASTTIPVKSSATDLMQNTRVLIDYSDMVGASESIFSHRETSDTVPFRVHMMGDASDTGTAYHAYLQHVEFGKDAREELARMCKEGLLSQEQASLLDEDALDRMMHIPCLMALKGKHTLREQTFLVSLQADEIYDTDATDEVVFQGAIDLISEDENGVSLIDYKFSSHSDEQIKSDYSVQIKLYRKAIARVMKIDERQISAHIVNIKLCREIAM